MFNFKIESQLIASCVCPLTAATFKWLTGHPAFISQSEHRGCELLGTFGLSVPGIKCSLTQHFAP